LVDAKQGKAKNYPSSAEYFPVVWIEKNTVCSRVNNAVVTIDLQHALNPSEKKITYKQLHDIHRRNVYGLTFCPQKNVVRILKSLFIKRDFTVDR